MTVVDGYGFIVISRKAFSESRYWLERRVYSKWEAWLDLIQMAAYSDHERVIRGRDVFIPRGSLVASERFLLRRWGWKSPGKVRRFLESLVNDECIERDAKTEQIKLVNYEAYQGERSSDGAVTEQSRSSDGAVTEQRRKKVEQREEGEEGRVTTPSEAAPPQAPYGAPRELTDQQARVKAVLDLWEDVPEGLHPSGGLVARWLGGWNDDAALLGNLVEIKAENGFHRGGEYVTKLLRTRWQNGKQAPPPLKDARRQFRRPLPPGADDERRRQASELEAELRRMP